MLRRTFAKTGWEVGVIGLGTWGIGGQWGVVEKRDALRAVEAAIDCGSNFIDTADAYGEPPGTSERCLAEVLRGRRDRLIVATKVGNFARRQGYAPAFSHWLHVDLCCDASLGRMKTDYIDLYFCHLPDCEDAAVFLEAFDRLIDAGKIRAFGISTDRLDVAERFNRDGRCAAVQLDYSYLNRGAETELLPYCAARRLAAIVRGPLARGVAAGKYTKTTVFSDEIRSPWNAGEARDALHRRLDVVERVRAAASPDRTLSQTALRFVISHPAVTLAIPGAKDEAQARQNALAGEAVLSAEEWRAIASASAV